MGKSNTHTPKRGVIPDNNAPARNPAQIPADRRARYRCVSQGSLAVSRERTPGRERKLHSNPAQRPGYQGQALVLCADPRQRGIHGAHRETKHRNGNPTR